MLLIYQHRNSCLNHIDDMHSSEIGLVYRQHLYLQLVANILLMLMCLSFMILDIAVWVKVYLKIACFAQKLLMID